MDPRGEKGTDPAYNPQVRMLIRSITGTRPAHSSFSQAPSPSQSPGVAVERLGQLAAGSTQSAATAFDERAGVGGGRGGDTLTKTAAKENNHFRLAAKHQRKMRCGTLWENFQKFSGNKYLTLGAPPPKTKPKAQAIKPSSCRTRCKLVATMSCILEEPAPPPQLRPDKQLVQP